MSPSSNARIRIASSQATGNKVLDDFIALLALGDASEIDAFHWLNVVAQERASENQQAAREARKGAS